MNLILAFDSFKGSLSSKEVADTVENCAHKIFNFSKINKFLIADGGEGTIEALRYNSSHFDINYLNLNNLKFEKKIVEYVIHKGKTCIIESAKIVGINESNMKNPENYTSYGIGEIIDFEIKKGIQNFVVGLGGSGTNDLGLGMLSALGVKFYDIKNQLIEPLLINIDKIETVVLEEFEKKMKDINFKILSDVNNPLYGENGALEIYGPQKGFMKEEIKKYDEKIKQFSNKMFELICKDKSNTKGAGAAGGLGYAFLEFFENVDIIPGIDYILQSVHIEKFIKDADFVITGEGKTDKQTINGKAIMGIAAIAKKYNKKVIVISGALEDNYKILHEYGIDFITSIMNKPMSLNKALKKETSINLLKEKADEVFRLLKLIEKK